MDKLISIKSLSIAGILFLIGFIFSLVLVEPRYRYPCQDPTNWDKEDCKRPACEVHRECPDLIFKDSPDLELPDKPVMPPGKGVCK